MVTSKFTRFVTHWQVVVVAAEANKAIPSSLHPTIEDGLVQMTSSPDYVQEYLSPTRINRGKFQALPLF